jgi:hypothetical protein
MTSERVGACVLATLCLGVTPLVAWQYSRQGPKCTSAVSSFDDAAAIALDGDDNVIVAGAASTEGADISFFVAKLSRSRGKEIWRTLLQGSPHGQSYADAVASTPDGDVVAAGYFENDGQINFSVVRLDGANGSVIWRSEDHLRGGGNGLAIAVALDPAGDVIAAGGLNSIDGITDFAVVKYRGTTGQELWRYVVDGTAHREDYAQAVLTDASRDIFVAGYLRSSTNLQRLLVKLDGSNGIPLWTDVGPGEWGDLRSAENGDLIALAALPGGTGSAFRLSSSTGSEIWSGGPDGNQQLARVRLDSAGDFFAAGHDFGNFFIGKYSGIDGSELWNRSLPGEYGPAFKWLGIASALAVDGQGNPVAAGSLVGENADVDFAVAKFAASDGMLRWSRKFGGSLGSNEVAWAVAVDRKGDVVAAGFLENTDTCRDQLVVKLRGSDGRDFTPSAVELLTEIRASLSGLQIQSGLKKSLLAKLDASVTMLRDSEGESKAVQAAHLLEALLKELKALRGKGISELDADNVIRAVEEALESLSIS